MPIPQQARNNHPDMPGENTRLIISGLVTFAAGYGLHVLKARRDDRARKETAKEAADSARRGRKNQVMAFLNVWASEVKDNRKILIESNNVLVGVSGMFDRRQRELIKEVTVIEQDFREHGLRRLRMLRDAITNMTPGSVDDDDGRKTLLEAIRDLTIFLEKN